eukprot:g41692.t1
MITPSDTAINGGICTKQISEDESSRFLPLVGSLTTCHKYNLAAVFFSAREGVSQEKVSLPIFDLMSSNFIGSKINVEEFEGSSFLTIYHCAINSGGSELMVEQDITKYGEGGSWDTIKVKDIAEQLHEILIGEGEQPEVIVHIGTNDIGRKRDEVLWRQFEITKEVVLGLLKSIKVDKSPGPDGIYPRLLTEAREEIAGALTKIFVSLLATGEVPED